MFRFEPIPDEDDVEAAAMDAVKECPCCGRALVMVDGELTCLYCAAEGPEPDRLHATTERIEP